MGNPEITGIGRPLIFGKNRDKGIRLKGLHPEVVTLGNGVTEQDLVVHDEHTPDPALAFMLSRMVQPDYPEPIGVLREVNRPTYEEALEQQMDRALASSGSGHLAALLNGGETWTVAP